MPTLVTSSSLLGKAAQHKHLAIDSDVHANGTLIAREVEPEMHPATSKLNF